ncbi:MAG: 3-dehydroquinate dehydratase [Promethearchaeota archaeon]|nr:MAG: 3-dehydroquinate dehydratase [Candidatus Lokiarchaeota archaeon]
MMSYKICVSIPIEDGNISRIEEIIAKVSIEKPALIEFRLDYLKDPNLLQSSFLQSLLALLPNHIRSILTLRNHSEGGLLMINEKKRIMFLKTMINSNPDYLDIELRSSSDTLQEVIKRAQEKDVKLIFSYHDFEKTPSFEETSQLIESYYNQLINNTQIKKELLSSCIFKFIFQADTFQDNITTLALSKEFSKRISLICFCMGSLGVLSRISCVKVNSPFTYASYKKKTAIGQINIGEMHQIFEFLFDR